MDTWEDSTERSPASGGPTLAMGLKRWRTSAGSNKIRTIYVVVEDMHRAKHYVSHALLNSK